MTSCIRNASQSRDNRIGYASAGRERWRRRAASEGSGDRHEVCSECNNNNNDGWGAILQGYKVESIVNHLKIISLLTECHIITMSINFQCINYSPISQTGRRERRLLRSFAFAEPSEFAAGQQPTIANMLVVKCWPIVIFALNVPTTQDCEAARHEMFYFQFNNYCWMKPVLILLTITIRKLFKAVDTKSTWPIIPGEVATSDGWRAECHRPAASEYVISALVPHNKLLTGRVT